MIKIVEVDKVRIKIDLLEHGWAKIDIEDSINKISFCPSYIFDGLERLLIATLLLNKGLVDVECAIYCESPEIMLSFKQTDATVEFRVYEFNDFREKPLKDIIDQCKLIFTTTCRLRQLTNQIINAFYRLQEKYGIEEYKHRWRNEFPLGKLTELQALIKKEN